mmetsp:Transcript_61091/g.177077  ORF Transcript_61091/g.177077 Transcript_61091/m.177077 type:complete len:218 (-) Transcript_61091:9-662(-)
MLATSRSTRCIRFRCSFCASATASPRIRATEALMMGNSSAITSGACRATFSTSMRSKSAPMACRQRAYCLSRLNCRACRRRSTVQGRVNSRASHSSFRARTSYSSNHFNRKSTFSSVTRAALLFTGCRKVRTASNSALLLPGNSIRRSVPSFMPLASIRANTGDDIAKMAEETSKTTSSTTTSMMPKSTTAAMAPRGGARADVARLARAAPRAPAVQ